VDQTATLGSAQMSHRKSDARRHSLRYNNLMTIQSHQPLPFSPASPPPKGEQQFVLWNIPWENYVKIGELLADRPALRLTYDRGTLELMTTCPRRERYKHWLGRFLETIGEELNRPIAPGGSMTFQREDLNRGFELDGCFWVANELAMRAKLTWEPGKDPPPDVGLEIKVSRSAVNRMAIFAAFRIPEIWCYDGEELRINLLQADGTYLLSERSLAFPSIPVKELARFFPPAGNTDYLSAVAAVRAWVRSLINKPS
jgi:Uma2 family endonuclease